MSTRKVLTEKQIKHLEEKIAHIWKEIHQEENYEDEANTDRITYLCGELQGMRDVLELCHLTIYMDKIVDIDYESKL